MPSSESDFVHRDPDFGALVRIVADEVGVQEALVEKDYWVTHALWALETAGFRVHLKGGTSLSKGYGLIQRFSEDLDLKLDHTDLPPVSNWNTRSGRADRLRENHFEAMRRLLKLPDMTVELHEHDDSWRWATFAARYRSSSEDELPDVVRRFVQLEVGNARVEPSERRSSSSWIHDSLEAQGRSSDYRDNRPRTVLFVYPILTLFDKLDAISRAYGRVDFDPAGFIRHYEDVRRILAAGVDMEDVALLAAGMLEEGDLRRIPAPEDPAFDLASSEAKGAQLRAASERLAVMFWGERASLADCCGAIRDFARDLNAHLAPG